MKLFSQRSYSKKTILFVIIFLGFLLRFWKLGEIPFGLNRDEASLGYTAYSIFQTGRDEHGKFLPVNIQSFGDWKLPLYVYLSIPFVAVFGLSEFSIRVLSAIAGVVIIGGVYFLTTFIVKKWKAPSWLPLISSACLAFSPWAIHLSRVAYEANVALAFCIVGITTVVWSFEKKKFVFLPVGMLCLGLTLIGYHAFQVFTPLFILFSIFTFKRHTRFIIKKQFPIFCLSLLLFCIPIVLLLFDKAVQSNQTKYEGISIFSESNLASRQTEINPILSQQKLGIVQPIFTSQLSQLSYSLIQNFYSIIDPNFLFISGGSHGSHNIPGIGNMYWLAGLTLASGLFTLFIKREVWQKWLIGWLLIAMIAPMLTIEANHSVRFFPGIVPLEIISAYGIGVIWEKASRSITQKQFVYVFQSATIGLIFLNILHFVLTYFFVFTALFPDRWPWYMKQIIEAEKSIRGQYAEIYMQGESSSPYIYFLFYDPTQLISQHQQLEFYPPTEEGFTHVKSLGKIHFGKIDWAEMEKTSDPKLFIVQPSEVPGDKLTHPRYKIVREISKLNSNTQYLLLELR